MPPRSNRCTVEGLSPAAAAKSSVFHRRRARAARDISGLNSTDADRIGLGPKEAGSRSGSCQDAQRLLWVESGHRRDSSEFRDSAIPSSTPKTTDSRHAKLQTGSTITDD